MSRTIIPRYKLMLFYDLKPGEQEAYYEFVMNDFVPAAQGMGLHMSQVYHTVWGNCPLRQAEFVAEDLDTIQAVLASERWQMLESTLQRHAHNYRRKIVPFRPGFQI
ncbi:MAG: hypothetical protein GX613_01255 [Chloroflexi bacterium]|nr:hypothetical protein [Chloroflexota bacterium]